MRTLALVLVLCGAVGVSGTAAQEGPGPEAVVRSLFAAMKTGDADAMAALMHPDVRLVSTEEADGVPRVQVIAVERWLEGVRGSTRELDERIHDPVVHVDQGLAVVWTPYELFVDGALSHCGVDAFKLVRLPEGWRILDIADTRQTEGCPSS